MSFAWETKNNVTNSPMSWVSIITINHFSLKDKELSYSFVHSLSHL
jgi:hypothetical protein